MFFHRLVAPALGASLLISPVLVAPASAESAWTPPQVLVDGGLSEGVARPGLIPSVATNRADESVAVWSSEDGVKASFRSPGRSWTRPTEIGSFDPGRYWDPAQQAVMDPDGNATAVWQVGGECSWNDDPSRPFDETDLELRASYRPAGGAWTSQRIPGAWGGCDSRGYPDSGGLSLAVGRAGTATAAWEGDGKLLVSQHRPGGRWTAPLNVGGVQAQPQVVATPDGVTRLVWSDNGVWTSSSSAVGEWSEPTPVAGTAPAGYVGSVDVDPNGDLTVAWATKNGTGEAFVEEIWTVTKPLGEDWQLPQRAVSTTEGTETDNAVDRFEVAGDGTSDSVVWYDDDYDTPWVMRIFAATRNGDGPWGEPTQISRGVTNTTVPSVTANRAGTMVAWASRSDRTNDVHAVYRPVGGTWSEPMMLARRDRNNFLEHTAIGHPNGSFTVFFGPGEGPVEFTDFVDDSVAPKVRMTEPGPRPVLGSRMPASWTATDNLAGVRDVDVRVRSAGRDGRFSIWATWLNDTTATSGRRRVGPGRTYCFSARARDRVGNVGAWSPSRCAATPLDDRAARTTSGWSETRSRAAYQRTLTTTDRRGERLVLPGVRARQIGLVARTCPACGKVTVRHGGRLLGTVDLSARTVRNKRVFVLKTYNTPRLGKVVVRVVSGGKPVQIDGFVAKR